MANRGRKVYVITGPTSAIVRATALEPAKHGMGELFVRSSVAPRHHVLTIDSGLFAMDIIFNDVCVLVTAACTHTRSGL